jgi:hypothetical protein
MVGLKAGESKGWLLLQHLGPSFRRKRMDLTGLVGVQMDWTWLACLLVTASLRHWATNWAAAY